MTSTDEIVICDHDSGNRTQEDGISRKVGREFVTAGQEVPRAHGEPNGSRDEAASPDVLDIRLGVSALYSENPAYDEAGKEGG